MKSSVKTKLLSQSDFKRHVIALDHAIGDLARVLRQRKPSDRAVKEALAKEQKAIDCIRLVCVACGVPTREIPLIIEWAYEFCANRDELNLIRKQTKRTP